MTALRYRRTMEIYDGNPYVLVTKEQAQTLQKDWKRPMPVLVQINGQPTNPWHINMMPIGDGSFYLYLHGDVRKASNTKVGDEVEVSVAFDPEYRSGPMHPIPDWFQIELDKNLIAKENWDKLIPSRQKEMLRYFSWLKSEEAKQRNVEKAINALSGQPERFLGRSWVNGS
jgi:hypothetical protein